MIVVIESLDEYTKGIQVQLLQEELGRENIEVRLESSKIPDKVKLDMLLEWGKSTKKVNSNTSVYSSTIMRAAERAFKINEDLQPIKQDEVVVFDEYSCTNIMDNMCNIEVAEWDKYIEWAIDLEHNKLGVPEPDVTIYLSIDTVAYKVDNEKLDNAVQRSSAAKYCANKLGWSVIDCCPNGVYRSKESIKDEIIKIVKEYYKLNCEIEGNKKYCYYITYNKIGTGFGSININYSKKIDTPERIKEVNKLLNKRLKGTCIIMSIMFLAGTDNKGKDSKSREIKKSK